MKKAFTILLLLLNTSVFADMEKSPIDPYNLENAKTKLKISIQIVEKKLVNQKCEEASRAHGFNGFGVKMDACSFWEGNKCDIILPKYASNDQLGHELHHCLVGNFH